MVYFEPQAHGTSIAVTLVIGYDEPGTATFILLCHFHKISPFYGKKQSVRDLFKDLHDLLDDKTKKLERQCEGGSSGRIKYSKELKMMLNTLNVTPRKSKGVWST
jgi:hypothetical protein